MTGQELYNQIVMGRDLTNDDLNLIAEAVKMRRQQISRQNTFTLRRGVNVKFTGRQGREIQGVVEDVKIKNVIVNTTMGRYRVPANMLTAI